MAAFGVPFCFSLKVRRWPIRNTASSRFSVTVNGNSVHKQSSAGYLSEWLYVCAAGGLLARGVQCCLQQARRGQ